MEETQEKTFEGILRDLNSKGTKAFLVFGHASIYTANVIRLHNGNFASNTKESSDTFWIHAPYEIKECSLRNTEIVNILNSINDEIRVLEDEREQLFSELQ